MLSGNLPVADVLSLDPDGYENLIEFVGKRFRISGLLEVLPSPDWEYSLFRPYVAKAPNGAPLTIPSGALRE